jgi:hypothetical protein
VGIIIAAIGALVLAFQTNFLGIRDLLGPFVDNFTNNLGEIFGSITRFGQNVENFGLGTAIASVFDSLMEALGLAANSDEMAVAAQSIGDTIASVFGGIADYIQNVVLPVLQTLYTWFVEDALPAIITFIQGSVVPAFESFFNFLGDLWAIVGPHLERFWNWFITDGLPAILDFISGTVIPGFGNFINFLRGIWEAVAPHLLNLANWFLNDALPAVVAFVRDEVIPRINDFVLFLQGIWESVRPGLEDLWRWFTQDALPAIRDFIVNEVQPKVELFAAVLGGIWNVFSTAANELHRWFVNDGLPAIQTALQQVHDNYLLPVQTFLQNLWTRVQPGLNDLKNGMQNIFDWIRTHIIQPVLDKIDDIEEAVNRALLWLAQLGGMNPNQAAMTIKGESKDAGGAGYAGMPYLIGTGAQPELFVPSTDGTFMPNADRLMGGGGDTIILNVPIEVLRDEPNLERNANTFARVFEESKRRRG